MQSIDDLGNTIDLQDVNFTSTGSWQNWDTESTNVTLTPGVQHLRVLITQPQFNLNWYEFDFLTPADEETFSTDLNVFPNPSADIFLIQTEFLKTQNIELKVFNNLGQIVYQKKFRLYYDSKLL